jgi:hypothetical protein
VTGDLRALTLHTIIPGFCFNILKVLNDVSVQIMTNGVLELSSSEEETPFSLHRSMLKKSQKRSTFEKTSHKFVLEGTTDRLIMEEAVQELLCIQNPKDEQVQFVKMRLRRVFAIAVYPNLQKVTRVMRWFKKSDLGDDDPQSNNRVMARGARISGTINGPSSPRFSLRLSIVTILMRLMIYPSLLGPLILDEALLE